MCFAVLFVDGLAGGGYLPRTWRIVTFAHVAETREQARADMKFGLADFVRYFAKVATFPIIPPDVTGDPADYLTVKTRCDASFSVLPCVTNIVEVKKGAQKGGWFATFVNDHNGRMK